MMTKNKTKKIKKTWTLLPETVKLIEKWAREEARNENTIVDRLVKEAANQAAS